MVYGELLVCGVLWIRWFGLSGPPALEGRYVCALYGGIPVNIPNNSLAASCDDLKSIALFGFGLLDLFPQRTAMCRPSYLCT